MEKEVCRGKTKTIFETDHPSLVIIRNRDEITKNDDPDLTEIMPGKGKHATATTTATFGVLGAAGIPVAFINRLNDTDFLAPKCEMIKLEVVVRRIGDGSYLKRNPHLKQPEGSPPLHFHRLEFELFLKTSGGKILDKSNNLIGELPDDWTEIEKKKKIDDPFILNPYAEKWSLYHSKLLQWDERSYLRFGLGFDIDLDTKVILPEGITVGKIKEIARKTFLVLEGFWAQLGMRLIDLKIELGIDQYGVLSVADVIDNDSWRLRTWDWQEVSKQLFRDNVAMEEIADKYAMVANLVNRFAVPRQAIVLWRGSDSDELPEIPELAGIEKVEIVKSGHKSPGACLSYLENVLATYPEGGVILAPVGMSNGLGPMLAARTSWPVITVPLTAKERPHDVWSSLEMPSNVPLLTILSPKNAVLAALNILAQKNPVAYMHRQYAIEVLDK